MLSNKRSRLLCYFLFLSLCAKTQIDSTHILNFYYGLGFANPLGSMSKKNSKPNDYGKVNLGLNMKAGAEIFLNPKNAVSIDLDYGFFFPTNDSLAAIADRDVKRYGNSFIEAGGTDADMIFAHVCLGYSRLFTIGKCTFQTKICAGKAQIGYDFIRTYAVSGASSFTSFSTSTSIDQITYALADIGYYTVKPEIGIKYIFAKKENIDWMFGCNLGYFYAHPVMNLYSSRSSEPVAVLDEKLHVLTLNFSVQLVIKRQIIKKIKGNLG